MLQSSGTTANGHLGIFFGIFVLKVAFFCDFEDKHLFLRNVCPQSRKKMRL